MECFRLENSWSRRKRLRDLCLNVASKSSWKTSPLTFLKKMIRYCSNCRSSNHYWRESRKALSTDQLQIKKKFNREQTRQNLPSPSHKGPQIFRAAVPIRNFFRGSRPSPQTKIRKRQKPPQLEIIIIRAAAWSWRNRFTAVVALYLSHQSRKYALTRPHQSESNHRSWPCSTQSRLRLKKLLQQHLGTCPRRSPRSLRMTEPKSRNASARRPIEWAAKIRSVRVIISVRN